MRTFHLRLAVSVLGLLFALPSILPAESAAPSDTLRWVRARVVAVTPESLTLALRDSHLTLTLDPSAGAAPPAGSIAEIHYVDRNDLKRAILIFAAPGLSDAVLSKRPGRSFRGKVTRVGKSMLRLDVGGKRRDLNFDKKSTLIEKASWTTVASGKADVLSRVKVGDVLLVKYSEESDDIIVGDLTLPGTQLRALEVRPLL